MKRGLIHITISLKRQHPKCSAVGGLVQNQTNNWCAVPIETIEISRLVGCSAHRNSQFQRFPTPGPFGGYRTVRPSDLRHQNFRAEIVR